MQVLDSTTYKNQAQLNINNYIYNPSYHADSSNSVVETNDNANRYNEKRRLIKDASYDEKAEASTWASNQTQLLPPTLPCAKILLTMTMHARTHKSIQENCKTNNKLNFLSLYVRDEIVLHRRMEATTGWRRDATPEMHDVTADVHETRLYNNNTHFLSQVTVVSDVATLCTKCRDRRQMPSLDFTYTTCMLATGLKPFPISIHNGESASVEKPAAFG